jgi:hypothetical protein
MINDGDNTPIIGGGPLPFDIDDSIKDSPDDDLGRILYLLLYLHSDKLESKYLNCNLFELDDNQKKHLIENIQCDLGIF